MKRCFWVLCLPLLFISCGGKCEGEIPYTHVYWDDYNTVLNIMLDIPNRDYDDIKPCIGKEIRVYGYCKDTSVISDAFSLTDTIDKNLAPPSIKIYTKNVSVPDNRERHWYVVGTMQADSYKTNMGYSSGCPQRAYKNFSIHATYIDTIPDR